MENKGLLFIPDISGFSKFVNNVEIDHSRMIVQELLEILINSNKIGLEVSEVEGDAILFYKFGSTPELKEIYKQVEKMFRDFHKHLLHYDVRKYCQCNACIAALDLSLKVITHYGEFSGYNVKQFSKLIGKDVIVAHQLLKNEIKPDPPLNLELAEKTKIFSLTKDYETDIITLFHATGDFNNRSRWLEGIKSVEAIDQHLPRVGMRCRCVMDNEQDVIYSSSYSNSGDRIEFSETDEKKISSTYFILEKIADNKTKLTINFYLKKSTILQLFFKLTRKKKMEETFRKSLLNLETLVKEIE